MPPDDAYRYRRTQWPRLRFKKRRIARYDVSTLLAPLVYRWALTLIKYASSPNGDAEWQKLAIPVYFYRH